MREGKRRGEGKSTMAPNGPKCVQPNPKRHFAEDTWLVGAVICIGMGPNQG